MSGHLWPVLRSTEIHDMSQADGPRDWTQSRAHLTPQQTSGEQKGRKERQDGTARGASWLSSIA
eukprot:scaffold2819_cov98-Cylindrotheca_fusiformis.AAC.1